MRKWNKIEENKLLELFYKHKTYVEIGLILNRTSKSIKSKLNKLGLKYTDINNISKKYIDCRCTQCNIEFKRFESEIKTNNSVNLFCSHSCAAIFNNKKRKKIKYCLNCSGDLTNHQKKFCSKKCELNYKKEIKYDDFINNNKLYCRANYSPRIFKDIFLSEQNNKCVICENPPIWNDKELVFVLDHIDGNAANNKRENLRLVCPNCDSQLDTYKSKNKNSARKYRYMYHKHL